MRREIIGAITAAELQSDDPGALSRRWSQVLGKPAREVSSKRFTIALEVGEIRFVERKDDGGERLSAFDVEVVDHAALLAHAHERGCPVEDGRVKIAGVSVGLVESAPRKDQAERLSRNS